MAWVFADEATPETERLRESLIGGRAFVPALWPIEVGNVLWVATSRGRITRDEWTRVRNSLGALPVEIEPVSAGRVWQAVLTLADEHGLSVYDAMYLELALRMQLPLATLDRRLAAVAIAAGIEVPTLTRG